MSLDPIMNTRPSAPDDGRLFGVHAAIVTDNVDPDELGRVKVRVPSLIDGYEAWARLATLMAGNNRGSWFIPEVDDEVLVAFEAGDVRHP